MKGSLKNVFHNKKYIPIVVFSGIFGIIYSIARYLDRSSQVGISIFPALASGLLCAVILISIYRFTSAERYLDSTEKTINVKKMWLITTGILLASYGLCFLVYFPGVGMNDGLNIMCWRTGTFNQFPAFYGMFIIALSQFGKSFGTMQIGIALYTLCQVLAVSFITAGMIVWFWSKPVSKWLKYALLLYFTIEPLFAMYAIAMLKDTLFSLLLVVVMILTYEMIHQGVWFKAKWFWGVFTAVLLGLIFLRNNGSYLTVPFLLALLAVLPQFRKKLFSVSAIVMIGIVISTFPVKFVGGENLFQEKAGIPLQQIAAVVANDGVYSEEQADFIDKIMPLEEIKARYSSSSIDPIKWNHEYFDREFLNEHKKEFLVTWAKMLPANFAIYVKAYLQQTFYFWAPLQKGGVQCFYTIETYADNTWLIDFVQENGIHDQPLLSEGLNHGLRTYYGTARRFLREGILFWIMLASALLMVLKNDSKKEVLPYLPGILLWITIMISTPVSSSLRYVFAYVYSLPFYFGLLLLKESPVQKAVRKEEVQEPYGLGRLDIALLISIGCIVIGHIVPWGTPARNLMFSFQMPLLFVLTGFRMGKINSKHEFLEQLMADVRYLVVPYILFHVVDSSFGVMLHGETVDISVWLEKLLWASGVEYEGHPMIGVLWIINVLFWSKTMFSAIRLLVPKRFQGICCGAFALAGYVLGRQGIWLILSLDVALVVVFYLYVGSQLPRILNIVRKHRLLILAALGIWLFPWGRGLYIEFAPRLYPWFLLVLAQSLCGSLCVIVLSRKIERYFGLSDIYGLEKYVVVALGLHHMAGRFSWLWGYGTFYDCMYSLTFIFLLTALIAFAKRWLERSDQRWEQVFLIVFGLYVIRLFCDTTLISLPWPRYFDLFLRVVTVVIVWIRLSGQIWEKRWRMFLIVGIGAAFVLSCFSNGYIFLFDIALLAVGAAGISYKKFLKIYVWCGIIIMGLAMFGSLTGAVRDLTYVKDKTYRHSFGICYPTDFAAHGIYLLLSIWVLYENIPAIIGIVAMLLFAAFQYRYCYTECSEIVAVLSAVGIAYVWLVSHIKDKNSLITKLIWCIDQLLTIFMGICAGAIIWMSIKCGDEYPLLQKIDSIISGRLSLAQRAFKEYGIKYFGTAFDMVGFGGETVRRSGYNFVDSSFCLILVRYGIAALIATLLIYFIVERKALRSGKRKLMVAFALISIHSVIEHHLLELAYNPFLLLAFADISPERDEPIQVKKKITRNQIGYCIGAALLFLIMPVIIRYGKTIVTLLRLNEPGRNKYFIAAVLILAVAVILFIKEAADLIVLTLDKEKLCRKKGLMAAGSCCVLLFAVIVSEHTISRKMFLYEESLEAGEKVIAALQEADLPPYKVFVDDIPEIYKRRIGGISNRVMTADSAADDVEEDIVLIAKKDRDIFRLTDEGCWFGELSDREGIYTNSEGAVKILEENGISMSDHYSVRKEVDLTDLAGRNGLAISDNGGLLVEGQDKSLIYGSYDVIYRGRLRVEYKLKLLDSSITDGELARVRLSFDWGRNVVKEQGLTRADFDENGYCTAVIEENVNTSEGGEYLLFANGDTRIEIESISYGKVDME